MQIVIKERLRPFSHTPGTSCLVPGTGVILQAYPTLLKVHGQEVKLDVEGPVEGFTLEQDLERDCVYVFGQAQNGYFKVKAWASDEGIHVESDRGNALAKPVLVKGPFECKKVVAERLFLGSHKAQNWDKIDLKNGLCALFALGQKTPSKKAEGGAVQLLQMPEERQQVHGALKKYFEGSFSDLLVPRLLDGEHRGYFAPGDAKGDACYLLAQGAKLIRSLFFEQNERRLKILPKLPVPFDCGKMTGLKVPGIGEVNFEWSKKQVRTMNIYADTTGEVILVLPKEIASFRVDKHQKVLAGQPLLLEKGQSYFLDRFQK